MEKSPGAGALQIRCCKAAHARNRREMDTMASNDRSVYECSVCGYQYDPSLGDPENGVPGGTAFADLPADWVCPLCGVDKSMFNRVENTSTVPAVHNRELVKEYQDQNIIVYWHPQLCSHAGKCWQGLPEVFKPEGRPWINLSASSAEELIRTIDKCPTQALQYSLPAGSAVDPALAQGPGSKDYKIDASRAIKIRVIKDGPLIVEGPTRILDPNGELIKESDRFVLCRCGKTKNPPFCDGAHLHKEP